MVPLLHAPGCPCLMLAYTFLCTKTAFEVAASKTPSPKSPFLLGHYCPDTTYVCYSAKIKPPQIRVMESQQRRHRIANRVGEASYTVQNKGCANFIAQPGLGYCFSCTMDYRDSRSSIMLICVILQLDLRTYSREGK